jgi:hypothetical protein
VLDFIKTVLPPSGPYCIAFRTKDRKGMIHRACKDQLAAAKTASWGLVKGWDTYFCISSLKEFRWLDEQGKEHIRKKENCARTQVLVLDVDIDPASERKYQNKEDAIEAIKLFTQSIYNINPHKVFNSYVINLY